MRQPVELAKAYLLLNHGPVTLVGSAHAGRSNVMAASWAMPLDFDPPKVLLVIDKNTLTRELVDASGEFTLNIPARPQAEAVVKAGSGSGRDGDKWAATGLVPMGAAQVQAPLVGCCVAWLECKVIEEQHNQQRYDLFIAEVVAAWADDAAFSNGRWHFAEPALRTLHYSAGGTFFETGPAQRIEGAAE